MGLIERLSSPTGSERQEVIRLVQERATPLHSAQDLVPLMDRIGDSQYVLLGEASHGTSEYYVWRSRISRRLIEEKGFDFIAVEGDWPDCYTVNRYVKGYPDSGGSAKEVLQQYHRWPTWMWANQEIVQLAEWLRRHNDGLPEEEKVGFYGLDVYSLWDSLRSIMEYLGKTDQEALKTAAQAYRCFEPYAEDVQQYALATRFVSESCEEEVIRLLYDLLNKAQDYKEENREAYFNAEQNALVLKNAEHYYRTMIRGGSESWNIRDRHMVLTLERLMEHHGPESKGIVWEHNTHIGDARYTDMARAGMVNVGHLVREAHEGDGVVLVGFGSNRGTVIAGAEWGAQMERMIVPRGREGTWEDLMHQAGAENKLLLLKGEEDEELMRQTRGHRAIGVVYDPMYESYGNYVPTNLAQRYDAFLYIDESHALHPLHLEPLDDHEIPETFPTGM
ncbi:MAG: erythromycin esterase family protein [Armatimonadetes bacterium]|nr:erythromycin esterase family protein [Armatimonadota bacterium]